MRNQKPPNINSEAVQLNNPRMAVADWSALFVVAAAINSKFGVSNLRSTSTTLVAAQGAISPAYGALTIYVLAPLSRSPITPTNNYNYNVVCPR